MKLSNSEKMILVMLSYIQDKLGIENGIDTQLLTNAIYTGNTWALSLEMIGISDGAEENLPEEVNEVMNILEMWSVIEDSYETCSPKEIAQIEQQAYPFGKDVRFCGFDGNNETEHLSICRFLIEDMGRFVRFRNRDLNSHCPSLATHRRMLAVFEHMCPTLTPHGLEAGQIIELLNAKHLEEIPVEMLQAKVAETPWSAVH